jgi:hypothetical protein
MEEMSGGNRNLLRISLYFANDKAQEPKNTKIKANNARVIILM